MKITQQQAISWLTEVLIILQDKSSYSNGFGHGFPRWVTSNQLRWHIEHKHGIKISFQQIRLIYKPLADKNLIDMKISSGSYNRYSTKGWDDCIIINDYFNEIIK